MCKIAMKKTNTRTLRRTLGQYPTGVAVVTSRDEDGRRMGMTINSFCSVSMNPPLVAWCVDRGAGSYRAFERCGGYTLSVLAEDQEAMARRFATRGGDKFAGLESLRSAAQQDGGESIPGACAWLQCSVYRRVPAGDHLMLIGQVKAFGIDDKPPLVFTQGRFTGAIAEGQDQRDLGQAA